MNRAVLICMRSRFREGCAEMTQWVDSAEAMAALRELCRPRCGPLCEGTHLVVFGGTGRLHVIDECPAPPPVAEEFAACYPGTSRTPRPGRRRRISTSRSYARATGRRWRSDGALPAW